MAKRSPPIPLEVGSIRPCVELAAIAASIAFPPRSITWTAACAASGWLDAATPCGEAATDRPGTGRAAAKVIARAIMPRYSSIWHAQDETARARRHRGRHREKVQ